MTIMWHLGLAILLMTAGRSTLFGNLQNRLHDAGFNHFLAVWKIMLAHLPPKVVIEIGREMEVIESCMVFDSIKKQCHIVGTPSRFAQSGFSES